MQVAAETFREWENELSEKAMDKNRVEAKTRVVAALFCPMRCSNGTRYLPRDIILES